MNRLSSNLHKLRALHQQERSRGLFAAISYDSVLVEKPITSVQTTNCLGSVIIPLQSGELLQKAKEFCRQTRVVANKCKVFVGNVSYRVKSRKLKEFFKNFGEVIYAEIITDYKTKRSRGWVGRVTKVCLIFIVVVILNIQPSHRNTYLTFHFSFWKYFYKSFPLKNYSQENSVKLASL